MADTVSKEIRSFTMSRVRSTNTKPELIVRRFLFKRGFRFRLHDRKLAGKPDIVLAKYKTVIFVHGCFWHGHEGCKYATLPKSNEAYWIPKIGRNITSDGVNEKKLSELGWNVIKIWECELRKQKGETLEQLQNAILKV